MLSLSPKGLAFIRLKEGFRAEAYRDPTGLWTVGYGHTLTAKPGMVVTPDEAGKLLETDVARTVSQVSRILPPVEPTQDQFDALVSFAFNEGSHKLLTSTLLKFFRSGNVQTAGDEFTRWVYVGGRVSEWQIQRRAEERQIFLSGKYPDPLPGPSV